MTSLTGSAGEDFASILRALGYRMEKRPPLPPAPVLAPVEAAPAEAAAVEAVAAEAGAETPLAETPVEANADTTDAEVAEPAATVETGEPADVTPEVALAVEEAVMASADAETPATETAEQAEVPQEATAVEATVPEEAPADATAAVDAAPAVAAAPELVEVWRPGGRSDERRPRHDRNRHRHQNKPLEGAQPVATEAEAGEGAKRERHGRPNERSRRERNKDFRKPRSDAPAEAASTVVAAEGAPAVPPREEKGRTSRERFQGKPRDGRDKGKFAGKPKGDRDGGRSGGGPSHRQYATSAPPRERERPIDPNSPFAKLAALKEQLTAGRKD
jgi:ATP-dependent RNA helicase SUPV3L1/SUV3